jgi:hypothetical protein
MKIIKLVHFFYLIELLFFSVKIFRNIVCCGMIFNICYNNKKRMNDFPIGFIDYVSIVAIIIIDMNRFQFFSC